MAGVSPGSRITTLPGSAKKTHRSPSEKPMVRWQWPPGNQAWHHGNGKSIGAALDIFRRVPHISIPISTVLPILTSEYQRVGMRYYNVWADSFGQWGFMEPHKYPVILCNIFFATIKHRNKMKQAFLGRMSSCRWVSWLANWCCRIPCQIATFHGVKIHRYVVNSIADCLGWDFYGSVWIWHDGYLDPWSTHSHWCHWHLIL